MNLCKNRNVTSKLLNLLDDCNTHLTCLMFYQRGGDFDAHTKSSSSHKTRPY